MQHSKGNALIYLILGISVLLIVSGGYYYKRTITSTSRDTTSNSSPKVTQPTSQTNPSNKQIPPIKPGFNQYLNQSLKYGLDYPQTESLLPESQCPLTPCFSTNNFTFRTLDSRQLSANDPKGSLLSSDLYCSASGPTGSIDCQNKKITDYTNPLGVKGYKVTQTKIVTGTGSSITAGRYQDVAYVFPLPEVKKGPGLLDYAGILLTVNNPTQINLSKLVEVAETFFTL